MESQFENGYIGEFSRVTIRKHCKLMRKYRTEQLNNKIEEQGSMYGKSSQEVTARVLELRQTQEISKVNSMFEEHKIS